MLGRAQDDVLGEISLELLELFFLKLLAGSFLQAVDCAEDPCPAPLGVSVSRGDWVSDLCYNYRPSAQGVGRSKKACAHCIWQSGLEELEDGAVKRTARTSGLAPEGRALRAVRRPWLESDWRPYRVAKVDDATEDG